MKKTEEAKALEQNESKTALTKPEDKNLGGRPSTEITNDMLREIEIGSRLGLTIKEIAHNLSRTQKISDRTLYRRFKDDEDVMAAWNRGKVGGKVISSAALMAMVSNTATDQVVEGHKVKVKPFSESVQLSAIKYYDSTRGHYTEKKALEHTGPGGGPIETFSMSREDRHERLQILREKLIAEKEDESDA